VAVVFLDGGNRVIGAEIVAEGTVNQCAAYPRSIFEKALKNGAAAFIISHNHPGGNRQASETDWQLTRRLHEIGRLLDIPLLEHIIICQDSVVTLREQSRWPG
jgi:DNA repair protein RadC